MLQLRVFREGALLGELDLATGPVEIGDRDGDSVRWDVLGISAPRGFGGTLEERHGAWTFQPRDPAEGPHGLEGNRRLTVGDGAIEVVALESGAVVDLASLPKDDVQPVGVASVAAAPGSAGERLRLLAQFQREDLGSSSEEMLVAALDQAFQLVNCERGLAALRTADAQGLRLVAERNFGKSDPRQQLSRRVLEMVLDEGQDVFTGNAPVDIPTVSINLQAIRAICALPLRLQGEVCGVLYVDRGSSIVPFSEEDLAFLQLLAALVSQRLSQAERLAAAEQERRRLEGTLATRDKAEEQDLAWHSPPMQKIKGDAQRLLRAFQGSSLPVLISGESGTGKEVLSRWLHGHLEGKAGPFIAVNCAAIPHDLAEAELFGIEEGVASGVMRRTGRFQQADGGTILLDEVGEMDLAIQTKLLRVLESRCITRVGGMEEIPVRVRVISATNAPLQEMIQAGTFREDLYWRLNGVELRMPALRERREDIPALCDVFARHFANDFDMPAPRFTREAMARLVAWHWPGNVRELKQRVGALIALASGGTIDVDDLPPQIASGSVTTPAAAPGAGSVASTPASPAAPLRSLEELEREHVQAVLDAMGGDKSRAADVLGIHKKTLRRKLDAWGAD
jgi:DNA-binding NtrC family response regulator